MHSIDKYSLYIFDCDGVIFDSNPLKIRAMENALLDQKFSNNEVRQCLEYFSNNFGKSRFHHIDVFLSHYLSINHLNNKERIKSLLLTSFSSACEKLYEAAELTPNFLDVLSGLSGAKYIASGSAQDEFRRVFEKRGMNRYFEDIFGSPVTKTDNVAKVLEKEGTHNALMIGDSMSDLIAAEENSIDFLAYVPFSNTKDLVSTEARQRHFQVIESWGELI